MPKMVSVLVLSIPVSIVEIVCCRTSWRLGSCIACPCHGQGMFFTRVKKGRLVLRLIPKSGCCTRFSGPFGAETSA